MTISGTATDAGGGVVAGVEVSTDGGTTWHPVTTMSAANTSVTWSYSWIAHGNPTTTIKSRAVDDSGNLEKPGTGRHGQRELPLLDLGNQRHADDHRFGRPGIDRGGRQVQDRHLRLRHRDPLLQGQHQHRHAYRQPVDRDRPAAGQRHLHQRIGLRLAAGELLPAGAAGQRTPPTSRPTSRPRGTTPRTAAYFYTIPPMGTNPTITNVDSPPLHALRNTNGVVNGVYSYAGSSTFPTSSTNASNYWVDPVFSPETFNTPPGQVGNVNATAGFASATVTWSAPTSGDPVNLLHHHALHRINRADPDDGHREPGADLGCRVRPDQRHHLHIHGHRVQPGRHRPRVGAVQRGDTVGERAHVNNGGFENGLTAWTTGGVTPPTASTTQFHSGSASALLGRFSRLRAGRRQQLVPDGRHPRRRARRP